MIILAIFCNPISDLEFSFIYRNIGLLEVYTKKKAATFNLILAWLNVDLLDSFAFTVQLELESI
jgi:hypothetical protein